MLCFVIHLVADWFGLLSLKFQDANLYTKLNLYAVYANLFSLHLEKKKEKKEDIYRNPDIAISGNY